MLFKLFLLMGASTVLLFACGGGSGDKKKPDDPKVDITKNEVYQKGLALVAKGKCLTCHAIEQTITGPPYREIANKYAGLPDTIISHLAGKIISGGNGIWGQVYMTAHPNISKEDAEAMVKYILLLKK